jgi:N-6 DNA Methylase
MRFSSSETGRGHVFGRGSKSHHHSELPIAKSFRYVLSKDMVARKSAKGNHSANIGFEAKLWLAADSRSEAETAEGNRSSDLAIRGIEADLGKEQADTFRRDLHPDLCADFVLANSPFNPAVCGTNFALPSLPNSAFRLRTLKCLAPHGMAGFVLANGSMSSNQSGEGEIRRAIIEADLVDCMVALPGQLFYSTQIPVCLWFLSKSKAARVIRSLDKATPDSLRERRRALAVRRPAPGQRQLRLGAALHPPPPAPRHGWLRPRQ